MGEVSCRFAVELDAFHAQPLEKTWHDDAADRVDGVQDDLEPGSGDGFLVHLFQRQDSIQVHVGIVLFRNLAKAVDPGEIESFSFSEVQDSLAFGSSEEFSLVIQQLEGIPLPRVVGGGQDDASVGSGESHSHLRGWGGC